jgi:formamidopyrimidine-DNA glycosylase
MPELPEVETVVRDLRAKIIGYKIVDFWTEWEKSIKSPLSKFKKEIIGNKIEKVERRGKNILVYLEKKWVILIHLKMTGHLLFKNIKTGKNKYFQDKVNQYIRHIWYLNKGKEKVTLEFSDMRKFAKIRLIKEEEIKKDLDLGRLGVEPLEKEFTIDFFQNIIKTKLKRNIKVLIMDQNLIVGVGNIYASEALFKAKINPNRKAGSLNKKEIANLYQAIVEILKKAIEMRGTTDSDYRDSSGAPGGYQKVLKVYNREGEKCFGCDGMVKKNKIGQRGTFWCEQCQK